jgi:hypothetical protein
MHELFQNRMGRVFDFVPASFGIKADSGDKCTSLIKAVFDVHLHEMIKEGILEQLWDEHVQATATVFCQDGSTDMAAEESRRRRRDRVLYEGGNDSGRTRPEDYSVDNGNSIRNLASAPENTGSSQDGDSETTQLTLKNMGGVFLLHGIMAALSLMWAMISWNRHRYNATAADHKKKSVDNCVGSSNNTTEKFMIYDVASSNDNDEYFDASASGDEIRQESSNVTANDLRMELKQLQSIDEKLSALLDKKDQ